MTPVAKWTRSWPRNSDPESLLLIATLLLASTLTVMSGATIAPALPAIHTHFSGVENADLLVRLVLTIPALFIALGAPVAGIVIDRVGRKPMLIGSTVLYVVAGGSGYVLATLPGILAGRALLGIAVAGVMTGATTLIADYYTGDRRDGMLGLQAAFMSLGGVVFLPLGGFLADVGWRIPFLIYVSAAALVPFMIISIYEPATGSTQPPYEPTTCDPSTGVPVSQPNSSREIATGPEQFPVRSISIAYLMAFVTMIVFYMVPVQIPFYLEALTSASASEVGLAIATMTLFSSMMSTQFHTIRTYLEPRTIGSLVFGLMGAGYVVIGTGTGYYQVIAGLAITGLGLGLLFPNLNSWLADHASEAMRGRVLGGLTSAVFLGQFLSPIVTQPIVTRTGLGAGYGAFGIALIALCVIVIGMGLVGLGRTRGMKP